MSDMIRKMTPVRAMQILQFTNKAAAKPLMKAISTVLANAKQQNLDPKELVFKSLEINEGARMRRYHAEARGRVNPYKKRMSHIKVVVSSQKGEK